MSFMPTITTERLILRPHALGDFEAFSALWADPQTVRFIGGVPSTPQASWMRLMNRPGMWHFMGFGFLAIEERASGRFVGEAGFHEVRRDMTPSLIGTLETGWVLLPEFHGLGYAFEAVSALIAWAEPRFAGLDMTAIIAPDNLSSLKLADRLGFKAFARAEHQGEVVVLRRSRIS
ncbi:GNAT family N-acetyltransferase [Rhizobium sp. SSA_523]|uniref:GNAT family N-acetyltransferase n=1 Tax=Rhizobium sp. SSA_523 TaxID=2952477 RepID=UPI00209107DB|nr:GNAT family N-acetyltransferase [Rhizobium sp. SSA_523]MCO5730698.1 GNAT family N-acetyltransferase [Rhizobium sp. SSA_523]WKC24475.1 GNAT family N-acetyltransferase [Rhizobium sp. SSA_523]